MIMTAGGQKRERVKTKTQNQTCFFFLGVGCSLSSHTKTHAVTMATTQNILPLAEAWLVRRVGGRFGGRMPHMHT